MCVCVCEPKTIRIQLLHSLEEHMCLVWHPEATYLSVIKSNTTTYSHLCNTKGCQLVLGSIIIFCAQTNT